MLCLSGFELYSRWVPPDLNSSLMMSLGAGALKIGGGAKCNKQRGGIHACL